MLGQFFMQDMKKRSKIITIGEVLDMDWNNGTRRLAHMVNTNQLHSELSYGLYGASGRVFLGPDGQYPYRPANTTLLKVRHTSQQQPATLPVQHREHAHLPPLLHGNQQVHKYIATTTFLFESIPCHPCFISG